MKKYVCLLLLLISTNLFAVTGKQEFVVSYPDEDMFFINDGNKLVVLHAIKNPGDVKKQYLEIKCNYVPMVNFETMYGSNKVIFYQEYAMVNKKRFFYESKKTELLFYRDGCKKLN